MSGKRKQRKGTQKSVNKQRNRLIYAVAILTLTAMVGVAFFSPGWVFDFQDNRQCRDVTLEERENVDVAVLSTNYESSFYQRMVNFAESQAENTDYYVASEELADYQQLRDFLDSENGLNKESIWTLVGAGLLSEQFFDVEFEITAWKQYVIYSDDYAKGVNFILWYIELESADEDIGTCKLLLEANTGEVYGIQADTGGTLLNYDVEYDKSIISVEYSLEEYLGLTYMDVYNDASWMILAYFYSGLTESDFFQYYDMFYGAVDRMYGGMHIENNNQSAYGVAEEELKEKMGAESSRWIDFLLTYPTILVQENGNRLECTFPYGESSLVFRMQINGSISYPWTLHNITIGFPAIYSLIPEFT